MNATDNQKPLDEAQREAVLRCTALLADSPTFIHVLNFAFRMESKLAKNRHKGDRAGWIGAHPWDWVECMLDETVEVQQCFAPEGMVRGCEETADECADVANYCMMIADVVTTDEKERCALAKSANDPSSATATTGSVERKGDK